MDPSRLTLRELVAVAGAVMLVAGLFGPWYDVDLSNPNANIDGVRGSVSGWDAHEIIRWLALAAAIAPFVLAWIIMRGHSLSWARGEMTAVVAITVAGLIGYVGLVDRPGEPSGLIGLSWGWWLSFVGAVLMAAGSALRAAEMERARKPPGSL